MKNICRVLLILSLSGDALGGGTGGGNPPALELLQNMLMSQPNTGGLFTDETGAVGLGIKTQLEPTLVLRTNAAGEFQPSSNFVAVSDTDFSAIQKKVGLAHIDVTSVARMISEVESPDADESSVKRSYVVDVGEAAGELILLDRRIKARNSVNSK